MSSTDQSLRSSESTLPRVTPGGLSLHQSHARLARANESIPGLTQSMMKRPEQFAPGRFPVYLAQGRGALVTDVDGNEYIDFICGLGANSLGHRHPVVEHAITAELAGGVLHSLATDVELEATDAMLRCIPAAEMARTFKTGADATSASVRLARHLTKRANILVVGYNGWHDHFMFDTPGVPEPLARLTTRAPLFSPRDELALLDRLNSMGSRFALVLVALPYNYVVSREFLIELRRVCSHHGAKFVLDEIVTGFRLANGGAQQYYGVQADWVTVSKALAAGMPLSAIVGPKDSLAALGELQVSTTFGGERLSLAVCRDVIAHYQGTPYCDHIARLGRVLRQGVNRVAEQTDTPLRVVGYDAAPLFRMSVDMPEQMRLMTTFVGEMAARGVLMRRDLNFICHAHTDEQIAWTIDAAADVLTGMRQGGAFEGPPESR